MLALIAPWSSDERVAVPGSLLMNWLSVISWPVEDLGWKLMCAVRLLALAIFAELNIFSTRVELFV